MKLEQYCAENHAVLTPLGARKRSQVKTLEYLQLLAQQTGTSIRDWDLQGLFRNADGMYEFELVTEKPEINKRFFTELERVRGTTVDAGTRARLDPSLVAAIEAASIKVRDTRIGELKNRIDNLKRAADSAVVQVTNHLQAARQAQVELDLFENNASTLYVKALEDLLAAGSFEYIGMKDNNRTLELATTQDFILSYKNDSQQVDVTVNLGSFRISIDFKTARIRVLPHKNNVKVHNYYHPHVTVIGDVCWGNAGPLITQALCGGNYAEALQLTLGILSSYNDGSPYISLAQFAEVVAKIPLPESEAMGRAGMADRLERAQALAQTPGINSAMAIRAALEGETIFEADDAVIFQTATSVVIHETAAPREEDMPF